jgi:glycosyltransferase involved in cell wall biosynthesis
MDKEINSKEYWDERFSSGDWEDKEGCAQTKYFYNILLNILPKEIQEDINSSGLNICDVGCAEGDGTNILKNRFVNSKIVGIDISEAALDRAMKNYSDIEFLSKLDKDYDVIISSNTLEHFKEPRDHLDMLFNYSKKYAIILVPFEEYNRVTEHFFTFEYSYFNMQYGDFSLIFFKEYDCANDVPTFWSGKQMLLVFKKNTNFNSLSLSSIGVESAVKVKDKKIKYIEEQLLQNRALVNAKEEELIEKIKELNSIYSSDTWKLISTYYKLREKPFIKPFVKVVKSLVKYGFFNTVKKAQNRSFNKIIKLKNRKKHEDTLRYILQKHSDKTIIILPELVDWNIPLFQRPQHLAKNLAKEGFIYFYCTNNTQYDNVGGFKEVLSGCYLTNCFDLVDNIKNRKKYYDLSSTDNNTDWSFAKSRVEKGDGVFYQYIDEISDNISGHKVPEQTWEKHNNILKDERFIVIPSATKLENDVKKHRSKNYKLVTNGVEIEHFSKDIEYDEYPKEIKKIVDKKKPIIGYFGAFASWFDYELVKKLAKEREDLEIVLLGVDYDGSIKKAGFEKFENITILGPIEYQKLPNYAACFDVSTIPFVINDITESTSPIKLFEYMAMGKPIVTTDMPECRKYESVLIGKNHEEFIQKIDEALSLVDDKEYKKILKKEANENSWESKAKDIASMLSV